MLAASSIVLWTRSAPATRATPPPTHHSPSSSGWRDNASSVQLVDDQLVDDQRFDDDRILVSQAGAESGPFDQRAEQIEIGIRRDHDIKAPAGLETLAGLIE